MRIFYTIGLALLAAAATTLAVFQAVDGNLARITGWYQFRAGMPLFSGEHNGEINKVSWMRIKDLHDTIECERDGNGDWWIITPFKDRMNPAAAGAILGFTENARMVSSLEINDETKKYMREYGVDTAPISITLKKQLDKDDYTTVARYTMGSTSPWLAESKNNEALIPTTYLRTNFYGRDKRVHVVSGNILSHFKNGLKSLRDPHPLLFNPEELISIRIENKGASLRLSRIDSEKWSILSPVITAANPDKVNQLIGDLNKLTALRVENRNDVKLPSEPVTRIILSIGSPENQIELALYAPFNKKGDNRNVCYATVSNRDAVFTLPTESNVQRNGPCSELINAVCQLPVLPESIIQQIRQRNSTTYTNELKLSLKELRSMQFASVKADDVARIVLRKPRDYQAQDDNQQESSLSLILVPGDKESQVEDRWICSAGIGTPAQEAETSVVSKFLNALSNIPAIEVVEDAPPGSDMSDLKRKYGLNKPSCCLYILPRPCVVRSTVFGVELPLVKDRSPMVFYITRHLNPITGKKESFGIEEGSNSIYKLDPAFTKQISFRVEKWKSRRLMNFPISSIRRVTMGFQQARIELEHDYIGASWTGTLNGEDITQKINPHRATGYIRSLSKLKVAQWLEFNDAAANVALRHPVFFVKLDMEITDYSDLNTSIIEQRDDEPIAGTPEAMLEEVDDIDRHLREMALTERKTIKRTLTLEIAPALNMGNKPFFYGRILETGELFILNNENANSLANSVLDM